MERKVVPISNVPLNPPNNTLYISNLPEKLRKMDLENLLETLFAPYGKLLQIQIRKTLLMKGQAFVVFENIENAQKAMDALQSYPIYFKPMFINFARFKSHIISKQDGSFEIENAKHVAFKKEKQMRPRVTRRQAMQQLFASGAPTPNVLPHIPSGELPNKVLFLQDLPAGTTEEVKILFQVFAGFKEIRLIPGRTDICFVEFENEFQSTIAKNALDKHNLAGKPLNIVYAKK